MTKENDTEYEVLLDELDALKLRVGVLENELKPKKTAKSTKKRPK